MAKDPGLSFKTEQDFQKSMGTTMNPKAFQQVVQQLRTNNLSAKSISADNISAKTLAEPVVKDSKEIQSKQEERKSGQHLLESNKKLTTNIEKLTKTISDSVLGKNKVKADRAEEIAGKQKLDYRGIGQQFKEKIMGRGGDKWDRESLKYKFGSVRGIMGTLGLRGLPGADNAMAKREEIKQTATRMTEANAGMENLKQFAVREADGKTINKKASQKNVEKYYEERGIKVQAAKANLQAEQYNRNKFREAGISDEEFDRTTGGKIQNKKLAEAGQAVIDVDPTLQGEKKGAIKFAGPDDGDKLNVSEEEESQLRAIESASQPMEELINITKVENERKAKADSDMLLAMQNMKAAAGGGALGGIADAASNMLGGKGAVLKKGAGYLSKVGGVGKLAKGFGIGAIGALAGEGLQYGGDKLKEAGYEKTGKAVGVAGTATKYAGYGAMIGSVIPGVGTAIGGGIGGLIGAGKGIYDNYYKDSPKTIEGKVTQEELDENMYGEVIDPNDPLVKKAKAEMDAEEGVITDTQAMKSKYYKPASDSLISKDIAIDKAKMQIAADRQNANKVAAQSADNAAAKLPSKNATSNNIVNAPTTISKQTQNTAVNVPVRDQDHSIRKYYNSRFAT